MIYRTREGDLLDWICWRHYGHLQGTVEAALNANPGLAELGPVLPGGVNIVLPELPATPTRATIRLWS